MPFLRWRERMLVIMDHNLLILGAGQYRFVAAETARAMGCFGKIECLDDHHPDAIGKLSDYLKFRETYDTAFVAMGNPELRLTWLDNLEEAGYSLPVLIHPMAYVSPSATLMGGSIVEPMAVVQSNAMVKKGCLICAGSVVNHNAVVETGCQIDCGGIVMSNGTVPPKTRVPCGTVVQRN